MRCELWKVYKASRNQQADIKKNRGKMTSASWLMPLRCCSTTLTWLLSALDAQQHLNLLRCTAAGRLGHRLPQGSCETHLSPCSSRQRQGMVLTTRVCAAPTTAPTAYVYRVTAPVGLQLKGS